MVCRSIIVAPGFIAIACGARAKKAPCSVLGCGRPHTRLCDYPLKGGGTCDAKLCGTHATRMGEDSGNKSPSLTTSMSEYARSGDAATPRSAPRTPFLR
jgi:hypothetical protein